MGLGLVGEKGRTTQLWKRGPLLWQQDDAIHDNWSESLSRAWRRICGAPLPEHRLCLHYDGGDAFYYLAENGYTWCMSYEGGAIWAPLGFRREETAHQSP